MGPRQMPKEVPYGATDPDVSRVRHPAAFLSLQTMLGQLLQSSLQDQVFDMLAACAAGISSAGWCHGLGSAETAARRV
jgi:hypothetical protein